MFGALCIFKCILYIEVTQSCPTLCNILDCSLPGSSIHWISRQGYWSGSPFPSPGHIPKPGIETRSPSLQADALPSEPPGKSQIHKLPVLRDFCLLWLFWPKFCNSLTSMVVEHFKQFIYL